MKRFLSAGEGYAPFPTNINYWLPRYFPAWRARFLYIFVFFMCLQAVEAKGTDPASDMGRAVFSTASAEAVPQQITLSGLVVDTIQIDPIRRMHIGEVLPEHVWDLPLQVVNHAEGKTTIRLGDFRGKIIVLDFWATWCNSCIRQFPAIDSMNNLFQEELVVLLINSKRFRDNATSVDRLLSVRAPSLFSVVEDHVLNALFYPKVLPHYVWIDPKGMVRGETFSEFFTFDNAKAQIDRINYIRSLWDKFKKQ